MSLGIDARTEQAINEFTRYNEKVKELNRRHALANLGLWVQKDGTTIAIKNMTSQHIKNSFNMLCRKMPYYSDDTTALAVRYLQLFEAELASRTPMYDPAFAEE